MTVTCMIMLNKCRTTGLKLNPDKCKINQKIKCSEDGVQFGHNKVQP